MGWASGPPSGEGSSSSIPNNVSERAWIGEREGAPLAERRLRLGFVGCGMMGQLAHLENYARLPNVELVALAEGRPRLARLVAERHGFRRIYTDHRALADDPEVDAVVSVMGFDLNYGVVRDLLAAGKHVTTEKAMCLTAGGADELVRLAESSGRVYQVGYMKRFDPAVLQAKEWIAARRVDNAHGPLLYARIWCAHGDWTWHTPPPLTTDEKPPAYDTPREPRPEGETEEGVPLGGELAQLLQPPDQPPPLAVG